MSALNGLAPTILGMQGVLLRAAAAAGVPGCDRVFPPFQRLQYMRDMFSGRGKLGPLDSARYPDMRWTSVREVVAGRERSAA